MSKRKSLKQRYDQAKKAYEDALVDEQNKVGALVMQQYEKGTIKDQELVNQIAKLIGDEVVNTKNNITSHQSNEIDSSLSN